MEDEQKQIAPARAKKSRSREQRKKPASAPSENINQTAQEPLSTTVQSSNNPAPSENKPKRNMGGGKRYPKKSKDDSTGEGGNQKLSAAAAPFVPKKAATPATAAPAPVGTGVFCTICSDEVTFMAVGACNHPVCSVCSLRLRFKSKNDDCAICKAKLPVVVVYDCRQYPEDIRFTELGVTDSAEDLFDGPPLPGTQVDASNRMLFLNCKEHYVTLTSFKRINCPCVEVHCTYEAPSHSALLQHLNNAHGGVTMCSLCLDNRPLFMHEHELMTKKELQYHMAGSANHPESAFFRDGNPHKFTSGHPRCEFCKTHLFDQLALYNHLQQKHFTCHLCDESMMFRYYQDLGCLRDHHKRHHFMCQLCDEDPSMSDSDVCYSFRTGEEYRDHLRSYHAVRDCTRYMQAVNKVNYHHHRRQHQQDARRLEHYDLDVGSANPFSQQDAPSRRNGGGGSGGGGGIPRGGSMSHRAGTAAQDVIPTADDFVPLIPPNMRVAGKISGTGRMMGLDDSDLAMQAMADAAYRQAAVRNQLHNPARVPSANAFPSLGGATTGSKSATTPAVPTTATAAAAAVHTHSTAAKDAAKPAAATAHPLSLVNRIKATTSTASQQQQQRKQQQLEEDKRVARNVALAEALGIASKEQNNLTTEVVGATTSHQAYRQPIMEALAKYRLPATVLFAPLYPPEMITWAKKNHNELCKVERRLQALMADPKASSLALKPMKATERLMMHCVAKYYHLHTYEYDPEPYRYVNVVKTVQSAVPEVLLSDACLATTTFSPYKLAPYVGKDPAAISAASTPTIYLQLDEGLIMTWGRSTDRKTQASVKPYAFNSSMVIFAEVILKLQELMMEYQQSVDAASAAAAAVGDEEHNVYEDFSLVSIASAGPTALAIKFRDIPTAQMAERLLRDLQTRASANATMVQNSTSVAMPLTGSGEVDVHIGIFPYYRVYPDFAPLPTPEAEEEAMAEAALAEAVMAANHAHQMDTMDEDAMDEMAGDVIDSWSDDSNSPSGHDAPTLTTAGPVVAVAAEAIDGDDFFHDDQDYEIVEAEAMAHPAVTTAAAAAAPAPAGSAATAAAPSTDGDDWEQIAEKDDFWRDFRASRRAADAPAAAVPRYRPPTGTSATASAASAQPSSAPTAAAAVPSSASASVEKAAVVASSPSTTVTSAPDTSDDFALALALQQQEAEAAGSRGAAFLYGDGNDFPTELDLEALDVGAVDIGPSSQARGPWQRIGKPTALAPSDTVVTAVAAEAYVPPAMRGSGGANNASGAMASAAAAAAPLPTTTAFIVPTATAMTEDPALRLLRNTATGSSKSNKPSSSSASASTKQPKRNQFALLDDDDDDDDEDDDDNNDA